MQVLHILIYLLCILYTVASQNDLIIVDTPSGPIQGIADHETHNKTLNKFFGIPYALPPIGDLRFRYPEPAEDHQDVLDATQPGASCHQPMEYQRLIFGDWMFGFIEDLEYDEDCLNLNIFVPGDLNSDNAKPVMVWFHGGAYLLGSANLPLYTGDFVALQGDVIIVVVNYRLGPYGFLTTSDDNLPGNYGSLDQLEALKWVRRNIAAFGGDPDNVVVFGESAGSNSITLQMMSPLFDGYFHKAIAQSGCHGGVCTILGSNESTMVATLFGEYLGCPVNNSEAMAACLRESPAEDINDIHEEHVFSFAPIVDGYFLLDHPRNLIERGQFARMPYMIGANSEEGSLGLNLFKYKDPYEEGLEPEEVLLAVSTATNFAGYPNQEAVYDAIFNEFFTDLNDTFVNLRGVLDMFAGQMFVAPMLHMLRYQVRNAGPAYNYFHTARTTFRETYSNITLGAQHGEELYFMWGAFVEGGFMEDNGTVEERQLCDSMIEAWTSFAHTGVPVFLDIDGNIHIWPEYDLSNKAYVDFSLNMTAESIDYDLLPRAHQFWNVILPPIGES